MLPLAHSLDLDTVGRRIGFAFERAFGIYGQWNARRAMNKRWPTLAGMDDHLLHDLGLNRIGVEVGFVQAPQ